MRFHLLSPNRVTCAFVDNTFLLLRSYMRWFNCIGHETVTFYHRHTLDACAISTKNLEIENACIAAAIRLYNEIGNFCRDYVRDCVAKTPVMACISGALHSLLVQLNVRENTLWSVSVGPVAMITYYMISSLRYTVLLPNKKYPSIAVISSTLRYGLDSSKVSNFIRTSIIRRRALVSIVIETNA